MGVCGESGFERAAVHFADDAQDYGAVLDHDRLDQGGYTFLVGRAVVAPTPPDGGPPFCSEYAFVIAASA